MGRKKILILGAGFGGLRIARKLSARLKRLGLLDRYEIILVDRNEHHTYTPLLYEVATTSKETANLVKLHELAAYNLRTIAESFPITVKQCEITSFDVIKGDVILNNKEKVPGDYVVLALGSETNYFGISGLEEHAFPLKTFTDAIRIRDAILTAAAEKKGEIRIVVGGGGSTGVELAGEIKVWCGQLARDFKACRLSVTIIEAQPTILFGFAPTVIARATRRLRTLDVQLVTSEKITRVEKKKLIVESGKTIDYDILIWTGGVRASGVLSRVPLKTEAQSRVLVLGEMECLPQTSNLKLHGKIYGLGDAICFYDPITKKPIPGVARAAISQANIVAHNITEDILVEEKRSAHARHKTYRPMEYPYVIPIGGKYAIAKLGPVVIHGFLGWVLKGLVELNYLLSIMPATQAFALWLKGLRVFVQNERLG